MTRADFTKRLGLPESASNDEVFAAFDTAVAKNRAATPSERHAATSALYKKAWG